MNKNIVVVAGTRPEIIKIYPVLKALEKKSMEYMFVWSGQHFDFEMSTIFFNQLNIDKPDISLNINPNLSATERFSNLISKIGEVIKNKSFIVYALGDTFTTAAAAVVSFYSGKFFVHDEAGVRSFDPFMIEEKNRRLADSFASFHLAPTVMAIINLLTERFSEESLFLTGSTLVDVYKQFSRKISKYANKVLSNYGIDRKFVMVTIHRRENLVENRLKKIVKMLVSIAKQHDIDLVIPVHPHTRLKLTEYGLINDLLSVSNIKLLKPLGYIDFLSLLKSSSLVITDSGGVQQEAFLESKPIITVRPYTEWIETVILGYNFIVDTNIDYCISIVNKILNGLIKIEKSYHESNPMGDGLSGLRVADILTFLAENIRELQLYRETRNNVLLTRYPENSIVLPSVSKTPGTGDFSLCFDKDGIPLIINDDVIDRKLGNVYDKLCLSLKNIDLNNIEYKKKIENLIKVDWKYVDKLLHERLENLLY